MFALHQRVRRRICQATFCALCVLPTTGLLAWSGLLRTSGHRDDRQRQLGSLLGMKVCFERVRYPQPGQTLYEGLELLDAETGRWIARCRTLDVTRNGSRIALAPGNVEIASDKIARLLRLVLRRLTRELPGDEAIWLVPASITLQSAEGAQTFDDVECRMESQPEQAAATIRFRLPQAEAGEAPALSIVRQRGQGELATTTIRLDTRGSSLPVAMFRPWLDLPSMVGSAAIFSGTVAARHEANAWSWEAAANIDGIDLGAMVSHRFPHHLFGAAQLRIDDARVDRGRLVAARGELTCPAGTIGGSLLAAAVELLGCRTIERPDGQLPFAIDKNYKFQELALQFAVDESGLAIRALGGAEQSGAILLDDRGDGLLFAPADGRIPLVSCIRALVPDNTIQVPATKETAALESWLPLPPVVPALDRPIAVPPIRLEAE